jgi:hypothetical protein
VQEVDLNPNKKTKETICQIFWVQRKSIHVDFRVFDVNARVPAQTTARAPTGKEQKIITQ